jgi:trk system potassium uptake protein TrkA
MRVAVAGAGDTGQSIARALLRARHQVLLIERYRDAYRPHQVPDADWMFADACELVTLQKAGVNTCDAVIAATGDDNVNVVFAFLAKTEFAVPRVVARINNPVNRHLFTTEWGVDVAVATRDSLIAAADQEVAPRGGLPLLRLHSNASLIELTVAAGSAAEGSTVGDLAVPQDAAVLAVVRHKQLSPPTSVRELRVGDELLVLASPEAEPHVRALVGAAAGPRAAS